MEQEYLETNRKAWDAKTGIHYESAFYDMEGFMAGKSSLNGIELALLGELKGKELLHLQCHFGQDTISLGRRGAKATGVDFSGKAISQAKKLSAQTRVEANFICTDIYSLPNILNKRFDIVFSSYGTIGWLPDIDKWAEVVAHFLKPGGKFIFVEFHPFLWMFDDDFKQLCYRYFYDEPIVEQEEGTYAAKDAPLKHKIITWNHGMGEVIGSLLKQGLYLKVLQEYDYSPYECFSGMYEKAPGKFQLKAFGDKVPMVYAVVAENPL